MAHAWAIAVKAEPVRRRRVDGLAVPVRQKRDRPALDEAALALRPRLIFYGKPDERHRADHLANSALHRLLGFAHFPWGISAAIIPGRADIAITRHQGRADDKTKD